MRYQYGIILSAHSLRKWQLDALEQLHQSGLAQLSHVVVDSAPALTPAFDALYAGVPACRAVDETLLRLLHPDAVFTEIDLRDAQAAGALATDAAADFYLLFDERACGTALAASARYGVWHFAHGDARRFSTSAPGFWEVFHDHDVTGAFLLCTRGAGGGDVALKSGYLPTQLNSFERNAQSAFAMIAKWPAQVCRDIANGAAGYFESDPLEQPAAHYEMPSFARVAALRVLEFRRSAASYVRTKLFSIEWTVARVRESPGDFIGTERFANVVQLYQPKKSGYFADPCLMTHGSRTYLFCEEYRSRENRGSVKVSELTPDGAELPAEAINEPHHLSYPHVFEHDGEIYCIPETGQIRKVCLYRCVRFPHTWEYVKTLIDGFEAADSTVVRHDGRWWLFCASSESLEKGYYSHAYIWHADELLGKWTPHVRNPVKIDARCARPAGSFFTHGGALYRPAQDCSRSYGGAIRINRVDVLSETDFQETVVGVIRPPRSGYNRGLHTISSAGEWCVVDVERYAFNPAGIPVICKDAAKQLLLRFGFSQDALRALRRKLKSEKAPSQARESL